MKYTQENLSRSQHEREVSARLRGAVDACIRASANEMWAQHNAVNNALNARVQQLEGAKEGLQAHLQKVCIPPHPEFVVLILCFYHASLFSLVVTTCRPICNFYKGALTSYRRVRLPASALLGIA